MAFNSIFEIKSRTNIRTIVRYLMFINIYACTSVIIRFCPEIIIKLFNFSIIKSFTALLSGIVLSIFNPSSFADIIYLVICKGYNKLFLNNADNMILSLIYFSED